MTASCGLCERQIEDGYLCPGCTKGTVVRLEALPDLYDGLLAFLRPTGGSGQTRGARPVHAPMPVSEHVLDLRGPGGMVGVVEDWRSAMHADLGWSEPRREGGIEQRLYRAVNGLRANILWIAASWPLAGAFAEEIRDLAAGARSVIDPGDPAERGTRVGNCPAVFQDGVRCGAVLRHLPGEKAVGCRWCGTTYPPATWTALKEWITEDEKEESCPSA